MATDTNPQDGKTDGDGKTDAGEGSANTSTSTGTGDGKTDGGNGKDKGAGDDDVKVDGIEGPIDPVKVREIADDRNRKGRKLKETEAALEKANKALEKLQKEKDDARKAELSEIDRLKEEKAELEAKVEAERESVLDKDRKLAMSYDPEIHVDPEYQDVVAGMMKKAEAKTENLDRNEWLKELKGKKPALFVGPGEGEPLDTAGGGQGSAGEGDSEIAKLEKQVEATSDRKEKFYLKRAIRKLKQEKAKEI
jgi:hypothetical protein